MIDECVCEACGKSYLQNEPYEISTHFVDSIDSGADEIRVDTPDLAVYLAKYCKLCTTNYLDSRN